MCRAEPALIMTNELTYSLSPRYCNRHNTILYNSHIHRFQRLDTPRVHRRLWGRARVHVCHQSLSQLSFDHEMLFANV